MKTNLPKDSVNKSETIIDNGLGLPKTSEEMKSFVDAGIDPYFVETKDTISIKGPQCIVRNLIQDKSGDFWLATWHGIIKYDGKVFTNYTLKEGLIHFHVTTLFEDSKENLWFGNARGGVYRYDGKSFTLFTTKNGLTANTANCIAEDKNGNIWFGTNNGINIYDARLPDGQGKSFAKFTDKDNLPFKQVASLFEDKNGNIWIGSGAKQAGGNGLCRYDGMSVSNLITPYFVMYMCQDKKGDLWLAHNKGANNVSFTLYSYDGKSFTKIIEQNKTDNPVIFGIIEDKNGNIWFGTAKGVCRYDGKSFNYFTD